MSALDLEIHVGHPLVRGGLALYPLFGDRPLAPDYVAGPVASRDGSLGVSGGDQGDVWEAVSEYATRLRAAAPTEALADVQQARQVDVTRMVAGTAALPKQRGVAVAIGGRIRSVDLFDRPATLAAYWDSLVAGAALDAVDITAGRRRRGGGQWCRPSPPSAPPTPAE